MTKEQFVQAWHDAREKSESTPEILYDVLTAFFGNQGSQPSRRKTPPPPPSDAENGE